MNKIANYKVTKVAKSKAKVQTQVGILFPVGTITTNRELKNYARNVGLIYGKIDDKKKGDRKIRLYDIKANIVLCAQRIMGET